MLAAPQLLPSDWLGVLISTVIFATAALGLHIVVGRCQLLNLGYAGFIGLGAYTAAVLMKVGSWDYWGAAIAAGVMTAAVGVILGLPVLRLRGDYFAIVTFGFSEIVILFIRNWPDLTGGSLGLGDIPNPTLFGHEILRYPPTGYWYLALAMLTLVIAFCSFLSHTLLGAQMIAIGDDQLLAQAVGIDVSAVKVCAFALSAGIGGLVGSFWALYFKYLSVVEFSLHLSVQILAIVILAGTGRVRDVIIAAIVLAPLGELLRRGMRLAAVPDSARIVFLGVALLLIIQTRIRLKGHGDL